MKALLMLAALSVLTGCERRENPNRTDEPVKLIRLSDGTRCAVMERYQSSAISCDWGSRP